jgi:hypothetical protein
MSASNRKRSRWTIILVLLGSATVAGLYFSIPGAGAHTAQPPSVEEIGGVIYQPFVDDLPVANVASVESQLSFHASAPASVGKPEAVYLHQTYRPQALGLVYRDGLGHFLVTEEQIDMTQDEQVQGLEQLAATCDPAAGCEGSWTMQDLQDGTPALVISNPPDGANAVIWIHGGVRFQVFGAASRFNLTNALDVANAVESAA